MNTNTLDHDKQPQCENYLENLFKSQNNLK